MQELISNAEAIISAEAKTELTPWEQAIVSPYEVAETLNPADDQKTEATPEEAADLLKNLW